MISFQGVMKVECYDHIGKYFQQSGPQRDNDHETAAEDANKNRSPSVGEGTVIANFKGTMNPTYM